MVKRADKTRQLRLGIGAVAVVVAIAIAAFGLFYRGEVGEPYRALDRPEATGKVRVVEYFSYNCPHCRNLERVMGGWAEALPDGVVFERVHVAYSASTRTLARAYLALKRQGALDANHERIFAAIHDRNRNLASAGALADVVAGHGVEREAFLTAMRSPAVERQVAAGERAFAAVGLTGVPALVVDSKYVINMDLGRKQSLRTAAQLAGELAAKRAK